jgi:hypothetical protein
MRNITSVGLAAVILGLCLVGILGGVAFSGAHAAPQSNSVRMGLPQDWSHRHVVFSAPSDMQVLLKIRQDPRLLHQWLKHNTFGPNRVDPAATKELARSVDEQGGIDALAGPEGAVSTSVGRKSKVDWSVSLGASGAHIPRSMYPAKYSFDVTAAPDCINDFVVFPTFVGGSATQASIVGYNQLYSTQGVVGGLCNNNGPAVKWAYNTGGGIRSSPTLSLDGTKVAFVARATGVVHVLTIGTTGVNGTSVTAPAIPGVGNNAIDTTFGLNGGPNVAFSELFVDYTDDVAYVGDDAGVLHKITGMFQGVPAEVTTGGWPVTVNATVPLTGPVFDSKSRNIFVADNSGRLSYVREVGSTSGACAVGAPPCRGATVLVVSSGSAIADAPIVDSTNGRVFTETAANGASAAVIQADTALGNVVTVPVGLQDAAHPLHNGDFDNNYVSSPSTGFYYVCGKAAATTNPTLYRIGFNAAGVMNPAPDAPTLRLARAAAECSPATEFLNTGAIPQKEWLFIAVSTRCGAVPIVPIGIPGGCVMSHDITSGFPAALTAATAERNGTSGIIVDNVSQAPQASSIYFSNEGNAPCGDGIAIGGCAVKLTQSGLQ